MKLVAVSLAHIEQAWVEVLPLMRKVVKSAPDLELSELWNMLRSGVGELWVAGSEEAGHEAIAITKLRRWGDGTAAYVVGVASYDRRKWREIIPEWREALHARGADCIIMEGRKGWERIFPDTEVVRTIYKVSTHAGR